MVRKANEVRVIVVAIGQLKQGPERDLAALYQERSAALGRNHGFASCELVQIPESRARRAPDRRIAEAAVILAQIPANAVLLAYDESGRSDLSSEPVARRVEAWRDAARSALVIAIGGADGLDDSVRARADLILAFGAATLPHGLVRVLALEQVYRTFTILAGHPYHRGEA